MFLINSGLFTVLPLPSTEKRLHAVDQLVEHPNSVQYFWPHHHVGHVLDDHVPFLNRGTAFKHNNHTLAALLPH